MSTGFNSGSSDLCISINITLIIEGVINVTLYTTNPSDAIIIIFLGCYSQFSKTFCVTKISMKYYLSIYCWCGLILMLLWNQNVCTFFFELTWTTIVQSLSNYIKLNKTKTILFIKFLDLFQTCELDTCMNRDCFKKYQ